MKHIAAELTHWPMANAIYQMFFRRRRDAQQRVVDVRDDDLAGCLCTITGGSAKQFPIRVGVGTLNMRATTPRECVRLQGVLGEYLISTNDVQALIGFGEAGRVRGYISDLQTCAQSIGG